MEKKFEEIIESGKAAGKTYAEINIDLKAAGANFHLNEDGSVAHWTNAEMTEGFIAQPAKTEDVQRELDRSPRPDLAGQTVKQHIAGATYKVTYNDDGTFKVAHKI